MMSKVIIVSCMLVFAGAKPSDLKSHRIHGPYGVISASSGYQQPISGSIYFNQPSTSQPTTFQPIFPQTQQSFFSTQNDIYNVVTQSTPQKSFFTAQPQGYTTPQPINVNTQQPSFPSNIVVSQPPQTYSVPQGGSINYGAQPAIQQTYSVPILVTTDSSIFSASNPNQPGTVNQKGMPFVFAYNVNDPNSGNSHSHDSKSDGNTVKGSYKVLLPDGRTQVVNYEAGKDGYNAVVTYEGGASQGQSATSSGSIQSGFSKGQSATSSGSIQSGFSNNVPVQSFKPSY